MISNESVYVECDLCDLGAPGHYRYGSWRHVVTVSEEPLELPCGRQSVTMTARNQELVEVVNRIRLAGEDPANLARGRLLEIVDELLGIVS